jgi:hypothetical protein
VQQSHSSSSLHDLAGPAAEAAAYGGVAFGAGQIDLMASMEALALMMMRPPATVDELFTLMRERSGHVLSGTRDRTACQSLACLLALHLVCVSCRQSTRVVAMHLCEQGLL